MMDKTFWRAGRGAKKTGEVIESIKEAPNRIVNKAKVKAGIVPKCVCQGGNRQCRGGDKKGKGNCVHNCGCRVI